MFLRAKAKAKYVAAINLLKILHLFEKTFEYPVKNCYLAFGNQFFQQIVGIHMGLDPVPFLFSLTLFYYDWEYINDQKEENVIFARRLIIHIVL